MTSAAPRGSGRATSRRPRRRTRPARTVQTLRRIHFPESGPPLATGGFSFGAADRWKKIPPSCTAKVLPRRFPKSPGKNSRAFFFAPEKFAQVNACNLLMLIAYFVSSFWDVRGSEFLFGNYFGCPRRKVPIKWIEPQKVLQLSTADLRNNSSKWLTLHFGCTVSGATFSRKSGHRDERVNSHTAQRSRSRGTYHCKAVFRPFAEFRAGGRIRTRRRHWGSRGS